MAIPKHLTALFVLGFWLLSNGVQAQSNPPKAPQPAPFLKDYWGFSYQYLTIDNPGLSSVSSMIQTLHFGHHPEVDVTLELQIGLPFGEETVQWNGQSAQQKINSLITGRFRKAMFNYSGFEGYGSLGLTYTNLKTVLIQNNELDTASKQSIDVSYGVGTRFMLGENSNLVGAFEYNRLITNTNFGISSLSFGIHYYF